MAGNTAEAAPTHFAPEGTRDPIQIELMIGIFAIVGIIVWILMWPTWTIDWHQYQKGNNLRKRDYQGAITHLHWLLNSNTPGKSEDQDSAKNPTYLSELGLCYMHTKDYEKSEKYYRLAQQYNTNLAHDDQGNVREPTDFTTQIGMAQMERGDLKAAEETFRAALQKNKVDNQANFKMGELEMKRGNYVNAAKYFKVVARHPWYEAQVKKYYAEIEKKLFAGTS